MSIRRVQNCSRVPVAALLCLFLSTLPGKGAEPKSAGKTTASPLLEAKALIGETERLYSQGRFDEALPLARRSLAIREKALSPRDPDLAESLDDLGLILQAKGEYGEAEKLMRRSLAIRKAALGLNHAEVAIGLNNLGMLLQSKGDYKEAEPMFRQALQIWQNALGKKDPNVAKGYVNLAELLAAKGDYAGAEPLYRNAIAIWEEAGAPELAFGLNGLGGLFYSTGNYVDSESHYRRALSVLASGIPNPPLTARVQSNLALLLQQKGVYSESHALYQQSLAEAEKAYGEFHPEVATILDNLGGLLLSTGDYISAELHQRRALEIRRRVLGETHKDYALSLHNLGGLLHKKGDYAEAESLYTASLALTEKRLGPNHPEVAVGLDNLAQLLRDKDDLKGAEQKFRRAIEIEEMALGPNHPGLATTLNNLGLLLKSKGEYGNAEQMLNRALEIRQKVFGPNHSEVSTSWNNLAGLFEAKKDFSRAEDAYRNALSMAEKALGSDHSEVATILSNLSKLLELKGDLFGAERILWRAYDIRDREALQVLQLGSDRQKRAFFDTLSPWTNRAISFHAHLAPKSSSALELALRTILRRKGLAFEANSADLRALAVRAAPSDREKFEKLLSARAWLARLTLEGASPELSTDQSRLRRDALRKDIDERESELANRYAGLRVERKLVDIQTVQAAIPPGAALVEYAFYAPMDPRPDSGGALGKPRFVAYVLPGGNGPIRFTDLGSADQIKASVIAYRNAIFGPNPSFVAAARALDALVMAPVRTLLGTVRDIYVAPDALLSVVPFSSLVDEDGEFLVAKYRFTLLSSGRDLLRVNERETPKSEAVVFGDPDYGPNPPGSCGESRGIRMQDARSMKFCRLVGGADESLAVGRLLNARLSTGADATETALKAVRAPRVLHIATHGFAIDPQQKRVSAPTTPGQDSSTKWRAADSEVVDPMLHSGLAFAGVNQRKSGEDDGILSALEASGLNLWGTQLVVLSACESGLGKLETGDGMYGFRRAFALAGAETQVTTLWEVDGRSTAELMTRYYDRIRTGGGRVEALRQAQIEFIRNEATHHPYYWAGFTASGDGRTLDYSSAPAVNAVTLPKARDGLPNRLAMKTPPRSGGCACNMPDRQRARWSSTLLAFLCGAAVIRRFNRRFGRSCRSHRDDSCRRSAFTKLHA